MNETEFLEKLQLILEDHGFKFSRDENNYLLISKGLWSTKSSSDKTAIKEAVLEAFPELESEKLFMGGEA